MSAEHGSPVVRERVSTGDPEQASEFMRAAYTDHRGRTFGDPGRFTFEMTSTSTDAIELVRLRHSMGFVGPSAPADGKLIVIQPLIGTRLRMTCGREETTAPAMLAPTWAPFTADWDDAAFASVTLDEARVAQVGAELTGLTPGEVTFSGMAPASTEAARFWQRLTAHVANDVLALDPPPPLVAAETFRQLAVAMLTVFPNTTDGLAATRGEGAGTSAAVRRAVAFIDANAHRDIDIGRIADAAGVRPGALRAAFRRHRGQGPLEYLHRVRLEGAHRDLQAGDPARGDTVAAIAACWGFAHTGRFSVEYRRAHGRSPGETLRG